MRYDMSEVIVERPRLRFPGIGSAYPRAHLKNPWRNNLEDSPRIESMRGHYGDKWPSENLRPLVRFLRSNVGRPWNKVHAEIAARISCSSAVQKHVLDHLRGYVSERVWLEGKTVFAFERWGRPRPLTSIGMNFHFYVCPKSGLLKLAPMMKRKERYKQPQDPNRRALPNGIELRRIAGIWYEVKFEKLVAGLNVQNKVVEDHRCFIAHKRQLNSREIVRYELEAAS